MDQNGPEAGASLPVWVMRRNLALAAGNLISITPGDPLPSDVLTSISAYYRRVTTDAYPMNRLVALVMLLTLAAIGAVLIGEVADALWYLELIRNQESIAAIRADMMFGRPPAILSKAA